MNPTKSFKTSQVKKSIRAMEAEIADFRNFESFIRLEQDEEKPLTRYCASQLAEETRRLVSRLEAETNAMIAGKNRHIADLEASNRKLRRRIELQEAEIQGLVAIIEGVQA